MLPSYRSNTYCRSLFPTQISIYTYLLYRYLGRSVLYGISVLLLTIPVNILMLRLLNKLSKYENRAKDARTRRTTETISNMKLLKLQVSWLYSLFMVCLAQPSMETCPIDAIRVISLFRRIYDYATCEGLGELFCRGH